MKIYHLKDDKRKIKLLQNSANEKRPPFFRTKWGLVGSEEWWRNIEDNDLLKIKKGIVISIFNEGHNDYPVFQFLSEGESFSIPIEDEMKRVKKGMNLEITYIDQSEVVPANNLSSIFVLAINEN